jgi:hypothetical protein
MSHPVYTPACAREYGVDVDVDGGGCMPWKIATVRRPDHWYLSHKLSPFRQDLSALSTPIAMIELRQKTADSSESRRDIGVVFHPKNCP